MNEVQTYLLKLVKEIDEICVRHDIDYYIFAGSMLGAERNGGFLPWDDDMDIVMTKKNYDKFKEVIKTDCPPNRVFEDKDNCPDYPLHFGKYTSTDTSSIMPSLAFGDCAAGFWIDIMYVAPMPVEEKKRKKVQRWFSVLCELENQCYIEYLYRYKGFYWRYKLCLAIGKLIGKQRVINYLKQLCDHHSDEDCPDYFLYHSLSSDFRIYSKDCFQKPVRIKYEHAVLNKSPRNRKLCREAYGDGWMIVPDSEKQAVHSTIMDLNTPYDRYKNDYMQFINHNEVMDDFSDAKEVQVAIAHKKRTAFDHLYRMEAQAISIETTNKIESYAIPMEQLIEEKRYKEIGNLFTSYIGTQWTPQIKENHIFVPMADAYLRGLLLYLICERQEFYSAAQLISIYKDANNCVPKCFDEINQLIEISRKLSIALWDNENDEEVLSLCKANEALIRRYGLKDFEQAYCLAMLSLHPERTEEVEHICQQMIREGDTSGVPLKLLGDIYLGKGEKSTAADFYHRAKKYLRNGLLLLDLEKSCKRIDHEQ